MIQSPPSTASSSEVVDVLNRDGCVVVNSLANLTTCDQLAEELAPFLDAKKDEPPINAPYGYEDFLPAKTRRIVGVIAKSRAYRALVSHPLIMSVCDAMLLPSCASYQLCTTAVLVPDPGSRAQALHREDQLWNLPSPHPVIEVATMWGDHRFHQGKRRHPSRTWKQFMVGRSDSTRGRDCSGRDGARLASTLD
jgi:hypothetical protein